MKPDTVIRWHRKGFRAYWRWKSRPRRPGRPTFDWDLIKLVRRLARENPLWGAPRVHSEVKLLGYDVAPSTVSKYMRLVRLPNPSQTWTTFAASLAELVPRYLREVPTDPFDRESLRYSPAKRIVYSVGVDLEDQGGGDSGTLQKLEPTFIVHDALR